MTHFLTNLFDTSDYPPRWECGNWSSAEGWLNILSDLGVWSAYVAIPIVIGMFVLRRRDIPFRWIFWLFAAFIVACGTTHLMEAILFWWPAYRLAGVIKLSTALVSWTTVIALVPVLPGALAMRSHEELEREIRARRQAEYALQQANTELRRHVEDLQASEERFRLLVEGTRDYAIFMLNPTGHVASWNLGAQRIKQYRAEEIVGHHFSCFYTAEDLRERKPERGLELAAAEGRYQDEGWRMRKDGSRFWADVVITALRDESGNLRGFSKITRDATERKQAEENACRLLEEETARRSAEEHAAAIHEQRERLRVTLHSIGDVVIATDVEGRVTLLNPVAEALAGWLSEDAVGQPLRNVFQIISELTRQGVENPVDKVLREGGIVGLANHTLLVSRDGWERPIDDSAAPIRNGRGELVGVVLVSRDVTEKRAAALTLQAGEERLRLALEAGRMGVWEWNLRTDVVWWSEHLEPLHGLKPGTLDGRFASYLERVHADDREIVELSIQRAIDTRSEYDIEFRVVWPDGRIHWMTDKGKVFCDEDSQPLRLIGVRTDVTDRKRTEDELRETERRFKAVFNQQFRFMAIVTPDGRVLDANASCFTATGIDRAAVLGRPLWETPWWNCLPPMQQWWRERVGETAESGGPVRGEVAFSLADGSIRQADVVLTGLRDDSGRVTNLIVEGRDNTEHRQYEQALRRSELRWRTIAEALPNLVWTDWPDGQCDWLSSQWGKYTGIPESELLGLQWLETVIHPDDRERTLQCWMAACADQGDYDLEYRIRRYDGEYHWFKTRGVPIRDETGKIGYWFGACTDIEDIKRMEAALREDDRRKNEFLATLAHELRNPLAPLRTGLQVLRLTEDRAEQEQAREMMERQLAQMVRLIDDLLDISRITCNKLELRKARISLTSVIENAVETARPLIDAKGHVLAPEVPAEPVYLDADLTRLAQVFWNLLNNRAKYSDPGGRIALIARTDGDELVVTVRDTGIGIPSEAISDLFTMFSQVDHSIARAQGGLGIGLALVKGLVEMHGGTAEAHSAEVGRGSEFVVRLPVARRDCDDGESPTEEPLAVASRLRILIVDDNRDGAASLGMMLSLQGHDNRTAHDGLEALRLAAAFRPDVMLLDIGLPKLNGYDVCRRIRQEPWGNDVFMVAVTGWGQEEDRRRSEEAGFDQHIVKPVDSTAWERLLAGLSVERI